MEVLARRLRRHGNPRLTNASRGIAIYLVQNIGND